MRLAPMWVLFRSIPDESQQENADKQLPPQVSDSDLELCRLSFVFDVLKGFLPVFLASRYVGYPLAAACGLAALLGHFFPPWLHFRGGKGVSTAAGIYFALAPLICLLGLGLWFILVLAFGYVSLASCVVLCCGALVTLIMGDAPFACFWIFSMTAVLVTLRHSGNFRRLAAGTERRSKIWLPNLLKKI